jgi:hypothetical protein
MRTGLWIAGLLGAAAACTTSRDDSRRTLDWLDANLAPQSHTTRMVLLPVAIPVGICGLICDTVVVNPVCAIDDAWGDTVDTLWTSNEESGLRRALFTPLAMAATPVVFACDWVWRCLIPTEPRKEPAGDPRNEPGTESNVEAKS